jgi:hypothetical protein
MVIYPVPFFFGYGEALILSAVLVPKLMRSKKVFIIAFTISLITAIIGFIISSNKNVLRIPNSYDFLYVPIVYMVCYNLLRVLYIKIYNCEPTYNRSSWYDPGDGRRQNWLDVIVYVVPIFISLGFPIILTVVKSDLT